MITERRPTVAIVDDDPDLLESLENLFESAGYHVCAFSSGQALIDTPLPDIDCLVTDVAMPVMDGFALHDIVKSTRPDMPVFLITGRRHSDDRQRATARDINGLFHKPFDWPALLTAVDDALCW